MPDFPIVLVIGIVVVLGVLILAGLLIGPAEPSPDGAPPEENEPPEGLVVPPDGPDRRAGGPGFRSAALALAHRRGADAPRRRRRRARHARSLNAAQSNAVSELGDGDSGVSDSRAQRSSAPE
jgi:hypothetical protein